MTRAEKMLYHQIHPLKLAADIASCAASCALLWQRQIGLAMLVAFVPAIAASWLIATFVELERLQKSAFGHYVSAMMTPAVTAQRMAGRCAARRMISLTSPGMASPSIQISRAGT